MKRSTFLYAIAVFIGFIASINNSKAQCPPGAVCATYQSGNIDSDRAFTSSTGSSTCPGSLTLTIPAGNRIDSVSTSYDAIAGGGGWMSEQRSRLSIPGSSESSLTSGTGTSAGTMSYARSGLTFANGATGSVVISMELGRTYGGSGCSSTFNYVADSTWEVIAYYSAIPACPEPTALLSSNISTDTASISWTESGTSTSWQFEFGPTGYTLGTGTKMMASNQSATLTGLSASTSYDWTVRSICAVGDTSPWSSPATFTTLIQSPQGVTCLAGAPTVIFSDDFETVGSWTGNIGSGSTLNNWNYDANGTSSSGTGPLAAHSGTQYVYVETSGAGIGTSVDFISPIVDLSTASNSAELSFWVHAFGGQIGTLNVGVSTSPTGPFTNVFTNTGAIQNTQADTFLNVGVNLDAYIGQAIYLNFNYITNGSFEGDIAIDLVQVTSCISCPKPSALTATNITNTAATLGWTENGGATNWEIEYGPTGFARGSGTFVSTAVTNPYALSGLSTYTAYDWYVRSICGAGDTSAWSNVNTFFVGLPMSGTFTVDTSLAAGGTNFTSISAFASLAANVGVSGPVVVNIAPNTYNEQVSFGNIPGSSSINTITLDGGSAANTILTHDQSVRPSTLNIDGTSYLTIRNMTIEVTNGAGFDKWGIHIWNGANNVTIDNNIVNMPLGTTSDVAGIMISNSETSDNTTADVDSLTISNNTVRGGERGISVYGSFTATDRSQSLVIDNNDIRDADDNGLYIVGYNDVSITNNFVDGLTSSFSDGMYSSDLENFIITGNRLKGNDNGFEGRDLNFDNPVTSRSLIANNMFIGGDDGLYLDDVEETDIFHNTTSAADYGVYLNDDANLDFRNNIFASNDGDYAFYGLDGNPIVMDYNIFFTTGTNLAKFGTPVYSDLAAFQAGQTALNVNSLSGDPMFTDPLNDLHIMSPIANAAGDNSVGIMVDFDGQARPLAPDTTVDIGADEFTPPYTIPFIQDFETFGNNTSGTISTDGWTNTTPAGSRWQSGSSTSSSGTGPTVDHTVGVGGTFVYLETSGSASPGFDTLVSPDILVSPTQTSIFLEYWYHMHGATMGSLEIYVDTNGTLIPLDTITGQQQTAQGDPWLLNSHIINGLEGKLIKLVYVGIRGTSYTGDLAVDDVTIIPTPSCFAPTALVGTGISSDSASVAWTENNSSTQWEISYGPIGFTAGMGTQVITSANPDFITGLSPATNYDWYVRSICAPGDTSLWSGKSTFTTGCPATFVAPYTETFDLTTDPVCWTQSAVQDGPWVFGGPGFSWNTQGCTFVPTDHTGNSGSFAALDFSGTGVVDVVLEMPVVDVSTLTNPYLDFYFAMCGIGYTPINLLYVEAFDGSSFVTIDSIQQNTNGWKNFGYSLSNFKYNTNDVRIRFRASSGANTTSMFLGDQAIDDVSIIEAPADNLSATALVSPTSGCGLSGTSTVEMTISNLGAVAQSNFSVGYSINGIAITPETFTGSIAPGTSANHIFTTTANLSAAGTYTVEAYTLIATDFDKSNDTVSANVINLPNVSSFPYSESFESSNGGWIAGGANSSWAHGIPLGSVIDTASNGTQAWVTNLSGNYNTSEFSFVNSPCLDFTNLSDPYLELDIWYDIETQWDGAQIQSSIDQGATWTTVGSLNDTVNWYNDTSRSTFDNTGSGDSWTGDGVNGSQGWITAKRALTGLGGLSSVQIRIVMNSDGSVVNEGFAFDNVNIYNNTPPPPATPYYAIGLINGEDANGVADSLNVTCFTSGTVAGVDLDGNNGISFTIIDQSGANPEGISIFNFVDVSNYVVNEGDSIMVRGFVDQFNGLTQIRVDSIMIISTGSALPAHTLVTALDETTESQLIRMENLTVTNVPGGSSKNIDVFDGTNTFTMRVDADTDVLDSITFNIGDVICSVNGIGGQFDNSNPYTSGYQIFPMRSTDVVFAPTVDLGPDTIVCDTTGFMLDAGAFASYMWSTGDTTQMITPTSANTQYVVTVMDANGCSATDTVNVTVTVCVGINEAAQNNAIISFYPNPNDGQFKLQIENVTALNSTIEVVSLNGQVVFTENLNINGSLSKDINLNVEKGLYFVRLINDNGVKVEKLIIK
jgi:hypothetical protein